MAARQRRDRDGWTRHASIGRRAVMLLEQTDRRGAFPRAWRLLVIAFLEGDGDLVNAVEAADEARAAGGDTPLLMLSVGAAHEMSWTWKHDGEAESPFKGKLGTAVSLYKRALTGDPTLLEARVRLGRALTLQGDVDEALATLADVSPPHEAAYVYLARLFEGDALETKGDLAAAGRAYELASRLMPRSQSAHIALSHLQHLEGRRPDAAARIQATTAAPERLETTDAWYWYTRGMAWRVDPYLATLRQMVTGR
jgi:tetratricopeptide (TPR) repeat protein